jgi:hypothetical protein
LLKEKVATLESQLASAVVAAPVAAAAPSSTGAEQELLTSKQQAEAALASVRAELEALQAKEAERRAALELRVKELSDARAMATQDLLQAQQSLLALEAVRDQLASQLEEVKRAATSEHEQLVR